MERFKSVSRAIELLRNAFTLEQPPTVNEGVELLHHRDNCGDSAQLELKIIQNSIPGDMWMPRMEINRLHLVCGSCDAQIHVRRDDE